MYLHQNNLVYNGSDTETQVINKLNSFVDDLSFMKDPTFSKDDNRIIFTNSIFEVPVYKDENLISFSEKHLERDKFSLLMNLVCSFVSEESFEVDDIKAKAVYCADEKDCVCTLIVLNSEDSGEKKKLQFDYYELVYNQGSWLTFRRQILGNHPGTPHEFLLSCNLFFDDLCFSDNCEDDLADVLALISRRLVFHLAYMNDYLFDFYRTYSSPNDMNSLLAEFAGKYGFDKDGSLSRTPKKKDNYTYKFPFQDKEICCEPHFKIQHYDDGTNLNREGDKCRLRIYFDLNNRKYKGTDKHILIGSMGTHA